MKCFELEKNLDLLRDGEIDLLQKHQLETHLADCETCRNEIIVQRRAQNLLKNLPSVLPGEEFDKRMLREFKPLFTKRETLVDQLKKIFAFSNPILRFGFIATIFIAGFGVSFLLGRVSVANSRKDLLQVKATNSNSIESEKPSAPKPNLLQEENVQGNSDSKNAVKYVRVPVIREKIVERIVYINRKKSADSFYQAASEKNEDNKASQFNLKDLQPVAAKPYTITRKGEGNE